MTENNSQTVAITEEQASHLGPILAWKAPSSLHYERGKWWYIIAGTILAGLVLFFLLTDALFPAAAVLVLAGVYFLATNEHPRVIQIEINELGIKVDGKFYPFSSIRFFWIIYNPPLTTTLSFATIGKMGRIIKVQLYNQNPAQVRNLLREQLPEVEGKSESLFEIIAKLLRL